MSTPRFFVRDALTGRGGDIALDEEEARHLTAVFRAVPGDAVTVFDGRGHEAPATVVMAKKDKATVTLTGAPSLCPRMPAIAVDLFVALPRSGGADDVLRTAVEAGARSITPISTERSVYRADKKDPEDRARRLEKIALAAMKQSGRNVFPEFGAPIDLSDVPAPGKLGVFGALRPEARPLRDVEAERGGLPDRVSVIIGPEGGLSDGEERSLMARGFLPVILTPQILRVETAVTAFLAAFALVPTRLVRTD